MHTRDPALPKHPDRFYGDWPGSRTFLRHGYYPTWREAARAAQLLCISSWVEYADTRFKDRRLPSKPHSFYHDFPGHHQFLGLPGGDLYRTWEQASRSAQRLGVSTMSEYRERKSRDPRLPCNPDSYYRDWPGIAVFLGADFYSTWQEASESTQRLGITRWAEYQAQHTQDPRLPAVPYKYYPDYPGWRVFTGRPEIYPTWQEAGAAARALGIQHWADYSAFRAQDPRLPADPWRRYSDYPDWPAFIGRGECTRPIGDFPRLLRGTVE